MPIDSRCSNKDAGRGDSETPTLCELTGATSEADKLLTTENTESWGLKT